MNLSFDMSGPTQPADNEFESAEVIHPSLAPVSAGTQNVQLLRIAIATEGLLNPIELIGLDFDGMGATPSQVSSATFYFTGTSDVFSTTNLLGTINNIAPGNNFFSFTGVPCPQGTNYF